MLAPLLKDFAVDAALKAGRTLWAQLPWAKDKARVDQVEGRVRRLVADATDLARNLSDESFEPGIDRLLAQFQRDMAALGLTEKESKDLTEIERDMIRSTVLEPARERRQTLKWVQDLESRLQKSESDIQQHGTLTERIAALERQLSTLKVALAVSLTLGTVATLLSILFFTRR